MALTSRLLARGIGWRVEDMICTSGPRDRPFEERHNGVCIGAVTHGTFRYRSALGSAVFSPGALVLGNHCHCFECSHDHAAGDRCLSFRFAPEFFESVLGAVPGARTMSLQFRACRRIRRCCPSSPPLKRRAMPAMPVRSRRWRCG
jgi:AraC family transcriptional regulator